MHPARLAALAALAVPLCLAAPAGAEVIKHLTPCPEGKALCPFFEAGAAPPEGWVEDRSGREDGVLLFIPAGTTFDAAPAWIYVRAVPNEPKLPLAEIVAGDQARFREDNPDVTIEPRPDLAGPGGRGAVPVYDVVEDQGGRTVLERVATLADQDRDGNAFAVGLILAAEDPADLEKAEPAFRAMLSAYR
ncbi:hypothetical protein [Prosthecomicrobium sp. N25]|uniref:hypothetical protein n=1 Tax=Prosthecomicrobium sp. N25 TaxID=3129254 RepID=UPI0030774DC3